MAISLDLIIQLWNLDLIVDIGISTDKIGVSNEVNFGRLKMSYQKKHGKPCIFGNAKPQSSKAE